MRFKTMHGLPVGVEMKQIGTGHRSSTICSTLFPGRRKQLLNTL